MAIVPGPAPTLDDELEEEEEEEEDDEEDDDDEDDDEEDEDEDDTDPPPPELKPPPPPPPQAARMTQLTDTNIATRIVFPFRSVPRRQATPTLPIYVIRLSGRLIVPHR